MNVPNVMVRLKYTIDDSNDVRSIVGISREQLVQYLEDLSIQDGVEYKIVEE